MPSTLVLNVNSEGTIQYPEVMRARRAREVQRRLDELSWERDICARINF